MSARHGLFYIAEVARKEKADGARMDPWTFGLFCLATGLLLAVVLYLNRDRSK